jgi:cobalt/nickel transport protein
VKNKAILSVVLLAIIIAIFAGFFASSHPDGLEKVAGNLKFEQKASSTPGIFVDYTVSFIKHPTFSTMIAGLFGIVLIYFIFKSIARSKHIAELIKKLLRLS